MRTRRQEQTIELKDTRRSHHNCLINADFFHNLEASATYQPIGHFKIYTRSIEDVEANPDKFMKAIDRELTR